MAWYQRSTSMGFPGAGAPAAILAGVLLVGAGVAIPALSGQQGPAPGGADPPSPGPLLALEEAIELALGSNPSLAADEAGAEAAAQGVREARAVRWPELVLSSDATRSTNPVTVFGQLLAQEEFGQENFDPAFLNDPDPLDNLHARLGFSQPLGAGGGIAAGSEGASSRARAARLLTERARQELVFRVTERYTGAQVAERAVEVRRQGLEAARRDVELTRDRFEGGLAVESDLLQARVRESESEAALAEAERDAAIARAALNLELGRDLDTRYALPREVPVPEPVGADLEALAAEATASRPDLEAARAAVEAARAGVEQAVAGRLPEIGWSGRYEANGDPSEEPFDSPGTNWTIGVGLRWPLFDGHATDARIARARAELERAERLAELAGRGVALEIESAARRLATARLRWREAEEAVALAERSAAMVRDRYREGLTTVVELLEAEALLTGARVHEVAARGALRVGRAALDLALGAERTGVPGGAPDLGSDPASAPDDAPALPRSEKP